MRLFRVIDERNAELAITFDDMRRSRAFERIAWMRSLGLYTEQEWERFGTGTRETAQILVDEITRRRRTRRQS